MTLWGWMGMGVTMAIENFKTRNNYILDIEDSLKKCCKKYIYIHLRHPTVCGVCVEVGISKRIMLQNVSQLFLIMTFIGTRWIRLTRATCNHSQRQCSASRRISKLVPQSFLGHWRQTGILRSYGPKRPFGLA